MTGTTWQWTETRSGLGSMQRVPGMGEASGVGTLFGDSTGRIGVYMGMGGPYALLRPVGGGREWEAWPDTLRPVETEAGGA